MPGPFETPFSINGGRRKSKTEKLESRQKARVNI